jgi:hypothetical protein
MCEEKYRCDCAICEAKEQGFRDAILTMIDFLQEQLQDD